MTKRYSVGFIYFAVVAMTLLMRVTSALDVYGATGADSSVYFSLVVQVLCFGVLPFCAYLLFVRPDGKISLRATLRDFGFKKVSAKNCIRTFIIGVIMIYLATVISYFWQNVLAMMGYVRVSSPTDFSSLVALFLELFLTALLPPLFEELTHRGLLYAGYRETGWKFVLVSALLFSLMHQNITQTGYTFFDGIIIALLMYYTGSIFPGMLVHFFNNFVSTLQSYAAQQGDFFSFMNAASDWLFGATAGIIVNVLLMVLLIFVLLVTFKRMRADAVARGFIPKEAFAPADEGALPLKKDIPFIAIMLLGIAATAFSLAWGIMR